MPDSQNLLNQFDHLLQTVAQLRAPNGCPWDQEQTHSSLAPYAIEETHELIEAIESSDDELMKEELGDVLFQVLLHAELATERNAFTLDDVIQEIKNKIIRRHPHVFANLPVANKDEVLHNWEAIKAEEKLKKTAQKTSPTDPTNQQTVNPFNIPPSLPALQTAYKIGNKTKKVGFDWPNVTLVIEQLKNEIAELEEALKNQSSPEAIHHEMGDILFSAAQVSRHLDIEPESSLREMNRRFSRRFSHMLKQTQEQFKEAFTHDELLKKFSQLSNQQKEQFWKQAKIAEQSEK